jgi:NADH-quinone oxidoreductase subunit M
VNLDSVPWITGLGLLLLAGAVAVALVPRGRELLAKQLALGISLVVLLAVVVMSLDFDASRGGEFQFAEEYSWIPAFGVS